MDESTLAPFRLKPWFSPRPWGRRRLEPWYSAAQAGTAEPIGEAWLTGPESLAETGPLAGQSLIGQTLASIAASHPAQLLGVSHESSAAPISASPAEFPLLVKLLFPADKLSVQVHPDDAQAQAMGQPRGKTECWYVLEAEPGAQIALGFKPALAQQVTPETVRDAIAAGTLEDLLNWVSVACGDMFFVDAGTVHAIGPGMVLLETQQTSDITFRMYDYGRPRELHVEQALRVMKTQTAAGKVAPIRMRRGDMEFTRLLQQQYFTVDRYDLAAGDQLSIPATHPGCLVPLSGSGAVALVDTNTAQSSTQSHSAASVGLIPGHAIVLPITGHDVLVRATSAAGLMHCWRP